MNPWWCSRMERNVFWSQMDCVWIPPLPFSSLHSFLLPSFIFIFCSVVHAFNKHLLGNYCIRHCDRNCVHRLEQSNHGLSPNRTFNLVKKIDIKQTNQCMIFINHFKAMKAKKKSELRENSWGLGRGRKLSFKIIGRIKNNNMKVPCTMPKTYRCSTKQQLLFVNFSLPNIDSPVPSHSSSYHRHWEVLEHWSGWHCCGRVAACSLFNTSDCCTTSCSISFLYNHNLNQSTTLLQAYRFHFLLCILKIICKFYPIGCMDYVTLSQTNSQETTNIKHWDECILCGRLARKTQLRNALKVGVYDWVEYFIVGSLSKNLKIILSDHD